MEQIAVVKFYAKLYRNRSGRKGFFWTINVPFKGALLKMVKESRAGYLEHLK